MDYPNIKEKSLIEQRIVNKYVSESLIKKEFAKIENEKGWSSKLIPQLLNTVFYCLVKEESWNYVKEFKNPTINYSIIKGLTVEKIKTVLPEIF